jgi:mevalonate kinase
MQQFIIEPVVSDDLVTFVLPEAILSNYNCIQNGFLRFNNKFEFNLVEKLILTIGKCTVEKTKEELNFLLEMDPKNDIENGLWFDSSIPHGFGLGSSGALIAALYETYGFKKKSIHEDKQALAKLEDYFHGSSSGIDPLVSLIQKPLLIHNFDCVEIYEKSINLSNFFLLNTNKPRITGPLVNIYQEKMKDPEFKRGCAEILSREVNFAVLAILDNDRSNLFHHLWLISKFQWEYFPEMIPTQMRGLWSKGLESGEYVLKLCGAGGGGYILGFSDKLSSAEKAKIFEPHELRDL